MRQFLFTGATIWLALATPGFAGDRFPYTAPILQEEAPVRSGPGEEYYPCAQLAKGDKVEVYRHDPGGWLAIRPPQGSYSLVAARRLKLVSQDLAEVVEKNTVAWIASPTEPDADLLWQVRLSMGETVEILGTERRPGIAGETDKVWRQIAPPAGEFRWIHRRMISSEPRETAKAPPTALENDGPTELVSLPPQAPEQPKINTFMTAESLMDAIEAELDALTSRDPSSWRFEILQQNTQRVIASKPDQNVADRAQAALEEIERFKQFQLDERRVAPASFSRRAPDEEVASMRNVEPRQEAEQQQGWLKPVRRSPFPNLPYALIDDAGKVLMFVRPSPGESFDALLHQKIRMSGKLTKQAPLQAPILVEARLAEPPERQK